WWDNLVIAEGHYHGGYFNDEYFDGETSPDPDLVPAWTGEPNNSSSTLSHTPAVEVSNGWSTDRWSVSGERSLRVPETVQGGGRNLLLSSLFDFPGRVNGFSGIYGAHEVVNSV